MFLVSFWMHFLGTFVVDSSESLILVTFDFFPILAAFEFKTMFCLVRLSYSLLKLVSDINLLANTEELSRKSVLLLKGLGKRKGKQ